MSAYEETLTLPLEFAVDAHPVLSRPRVSRDRAAYNAEVALRWHGDCLRNARVNWHSFEENYDDLVAILRPFLVDCWCEDLAGKYHNPEGTLTAWLWKCSKDRWWIWDFCDHYQTCHLRRGLIAYCKQVIGELKS